MSMETTQKMTIRQAAKWLALWHSGSMTAAEKSKLADWRAASPEHEQAWQHAGLLTQKLAQVPAGIAMPVLDRPMSQTMSRRDFIKPLAACMVAIPGGLLAYRYSPWRQWMADYRTATGERRQIVLADGSRMLLNTASAVNVEFTRDFRMIRLLAGEILIQTAPDTAPAHRPLIVQTAEGHLRALGTRFTVRQQPELTRLAVLEGAVQATPVAARQQDGIIQAGMQSSLTAHALQAPRPLDETLTSWTEGMLYVVKMPLAEFVDELARYRPGIMRCDADIAHLQVSGVFQLNNTDSILAALEDTLPVVVQQRTPYWVTLSGRA
ncbi:MAG: FecR domain-containing protein [Methylophilus sp.]|uniref:FecR domain-containing protein n=1 Tax=Methylophilus sp. TaxID=29541 RepID=UPI003FA01F27